MKGTYYLPVTRRRRPDPLAAPATEAPYGVVLLSRSSPDPRSRLAADLLARRVGHRLNANVALATMDHARARLDGALASLQARGVGEVVVVPLLLSTPAPGMDADLAREEAFSEPAVVQSPSGVTVIRAHPLGPDPALLKGLDAVLRSAGLRPGPGLGAVLASAGSTSERTRAQFAGLAAQWQNHGWEAAVSAFASGEGPTVPEAVARLRSLPGVTQVIVSPFAIAPGALTQRIAESAEEAGATPVLGTLHATDAAVDVVLARVRSAREGYLAKVAANSF